MGFLAILFWSTTVAFSRNIIKVMGVLNSGFFIFFVSGSLLLIIEFVKHKNNFVNTIRSIPSEYFYKVGLFFVSYVVLFYFALGGAKSKEAVLVVGLLNYLWPAFCFIFSIVILKNRSHKLPLITGILISFAGTILALTGTNTFKYILIKQSIGQNIFPYLLAFLAAVSWGAYSNLTKKYQFENDAIALPLLFLISSLLIFIIIVLNGELKNLNFISDLSPSRFIELIYLILFPSTISYFFWDRAMKKGDKSWLFLFPIQSPFFQHSPRALF